PDLLTVHDPFVTVTCRAGRHVGEVGPCVGFGVALTPELVGRLDLGEEAPLLLLGPVRDERGGEEALTEEAHTCGCARLGVLLVEDDLLGDAGIAAAVLGGPAQTDPPVAAEQLLPLDAQLPVGL